MDIPVPKPTPNPREVAVEEAFNKLIDKAQSMGMPVRKVGLEYLPTQELKRNFIDSCRAILEALKTE